MQNKLSFNQFATALAAFGVASLSGGTALASPVQLTEVEGACSLEDQASQLGETGDEKKKDGDGDDKKKKDDDGGDKKKKKHGGEEGGCGAGTCG